MITREIEKKVLDIAKGKVLFAHEVATKLNIATNTVCSILSESYDHTRVEFQQCRIRNLYDCTKKVRSSKEEILKKLLATKIVNIRTMIKAIKVDQKRVVYLMEGMNIPKKKVGYSIYYNGTGKPFSEDLIYPALEKKSKTGRKVIDKNTPASIPWKRFGYVPPKIKGTKRIKPVDQSGYNEQDLKDIRAVVEGEVSYNSERHAQIDSFNADLSGNYKQI